MQNRKMGMSTHVRRQKEEKGHNDINLTLSMVQIINRASLLTILRFFQISIRIYKNGY